jgi:hypothetical protein
MSNLESTVRLLATNCLLYVVNANTGELIRYQEGLVPYTNPGLADARSATIKASLRRWKVAS